MYNVFVFFRNEKEKKFFGDLCRDTNDDLSFGYYKDNYYFEHLQNNLFFEPDRKLIDYINGYCKNIRKFFDDEKKIYNKPLIVAVHPPGKKNIDDLLKWQKKMNKLNKSSTEIIVYYSSNDNENDNVYLRNNEEFNYNYKFLFITSSSSETFKTESLKKDKFQKFLKLLDARSEGKEAEFFDLKKKIDDLYHVFSLKALACKGIMKCIKREKYGIARNYQLQSFGNKSFIEILKELKKDKEFIDDRINGKLNELNPEYYEELSYYEQLSQYFKWYNEFLNILTDKKKEVEKGE